MVFHQEDLKTVGNHPNLQQRLVVNSSVHLLKKSYCMNVILASSEDCWKQTWKIITCLEVNHLFTDWQFVRNIKVDHCCYKSTHHEYTKYRELQSSCQSTCMLLISVNPFFVGNSKLLPNWRCHVTATAIQSKIPCVDLSDSHCCSDRSHDSREQVNQRSEAAHEKRTKTRCSSCHGWYGFLTG